ncbi:MULTISPECIES: O-antigen ligase family protein [Serratia]|uniref:O-antigen ligase family protein n=1 Tax=Serratia TaxID=613 RepID=UPI00131EE65E|nr:MULTISPECIES: hypothetical protein [Serratia]
MSIPCLKFMVMVYVSVLLLLGGYIYHYDMNYFSLTFPYSLVIGVVLFALLGVGGALLFLRKAWGMTPACFFFALGAVILLLPLFYSRAEWGVLTVGRMACLFGSWIIYFILLQYRVMQHVRIAFIYTLVLAAAVGGIWLFSFPAEAAAGYAGSGGRWPDAASSLLASGLLAGWGLTVLPRFRMLRRDNERWRILLLLPLLIGLSAALGWGASQTVCLSVLLGAALLTLMFVRRYPLHCVLALLMTALGFCLAILADELNAGVRLSNAAPCCDTLLDSLALVVERPWLGWGYGRFEHGFEHLQAHALPAVARAGAARQPYNELLLWWIEGGVVALAGMLCLLAGVAALVRQTWRRERIAARLHSAAAGEEAALAASGIPLLLCAQFSYPFGLSLIQWAVLTLLLVTLDGRSRLNAGRFCRFVFARRETA